MQTFQTNHLFHFTQFYAISIVQVVTVMTIFYIHSAAPFLALHSNRHNECLTFISVRCRHPLFRKFYKSQQTCVSISMHSPWKCDAASQISRKKSLFPPCHSAFFIFINVYMKTVRTGDGRILLSTLLTALGMIDGMVEA